MSVRSGITVRDESNVEVQSSFFLLEGIDVDYSTASGYEDVPILKSAAGSHNILSTTHADTTGAGSEARGDLIIRNASSQWARLAIGGAGTFLKSDGTDPAWTAIGAADVAAGSFPAGDFTFVDNVTVQDKLYVLGQATAAWGRLVGGTAGFALRDSSDSNSHAYWDNANSNCTIRGSLAWGTGSAISSSDNVVSTSTENTFTARQIFANLSGLIRLRGDASAYWEWSYNTTSDRWEWGGVTEGGVDWGSPLLVIPASSGQWQFQGAIQVSGSTPVSSATVLSSTQKTDLTDAGDTTLHYHSADRDRANHTGSQAASTVNAGAFGGSGASTFPGSLAWGTGSAIASSDDVVDVDSANVFTALQTFQRTTSVSNAVFIELDYSGWVPAAGAYDSPCLVYLGTGYDTSYHDVHWRQFVDVQSNDGATSALTWQSQVDAGGYATRFSVHQDGDINRDAGILCTRDDDDEIFTGYAYAGYHARLILRRSGGTRTSQSALGAWNTMASIDFGGWDGSGWADAVRIRAATVEAWGATAHGAELRFYTRPTGDNAIALVWRMQSDASFVPEGDATQNIGSSSKQVKYVYARRVQAGEAILGYDGATDGAPAIRLDGVDAAPSGGFIGIYERGGGLNFSARGSMIMSIDADNTQSDSVWEIYHDGHYSGGATLFKVTEDAKVTLYGELDKSTLGSLTLGTNVNALNFSYTGTAEIEKEGTYVLAITATNIVKMNKSCELHLGDGYQAEVGGMNLSRHPVWDNSYFADETIAKGNCVRLGYSGTYPRWYNCNAGDLDTLVPQMIGVAMEAGTQGNALKVCLLGEFAYTGFSFGAANAGDALFVPSSDGPPTTTAPSGAGVVVQVIGYCIDDDGIFVSPMYLGEDNA